MPPKKNPSSIFDLRFLDPTDMSKSGKVVYYSVTGVVLLFLLTLFFLLISGNRYASFLSRYGLYNPERGLYAGCDGPEGSRSPYCYQPKTDADRTWDSVKDGFAFTLYGN